MTSTALWRVVPDFICRHLSGNVRLAARSIAPAVGIAIWLGCALTASADVLLRDSFGFEPLTVNGGTRYDAASNAVAIFLTHDLSGLWAEFPNTSPEVWTAPGGHQVQTWGFSASSADPYEAYSASEPGAANSVDNGSVTVTGGTGADTCPDALLPFTPPATAFRVSVDAVSGANGMAVGFTTTASVLNSNFASFAEIWLALGPGGQGTTTTWTLRTNGTNGPSASGTLVLQGYNPLVLTYDPVAHIVSGAINGTPLPSLLYFASGINYVGFEGSGTLDDFRVESISQHGPISELYLTSKTESGGGKAQMDVVRGTNVVRGWTSKHGNEVGLAVNDTVRTLGVLSVPTPGDIGAEYTLAGVYTGTDYPFPVSSINSLQILDGASDGLHNYAWDFNNNDAWQFDGNWSSGVKLFHVLGTASRAGITYDRADDTLWLSGYGASVIEHRSLDGTLLGSFPVPHGANVALALDPADGTLWFLSAAAPGVLMQYSRLGQFLSSQYYPTLSLKNILGGEFRLPPRPVQLLSAGMHTAGGLQLVLNGVTPGHTNVVQSSLDLSNWTSISTNVAVSNSLQVIDSASTNSAQSFYRTFEIH